ncbi:MAG: hypothetical protein K1W26_14660 [Acetatifactor sp.]
MNSKLETWLDEEMKEFSGVLQSFKKKQKSKAPLWMAACLIGMVALGFVAGYDLPYVMRVHFPIGCVLALLAGLCFWLPAKISNVKALRKSYEKAIGEFFQSQEEQDLFVRQMESGNIEKVNFNNISETYPSRFIAGPDYWMYFNGRFCRFIRTADIAGVRRKDESSWVNTGSGHGKNIAVGVSLVIEYRPDSVSAKQNKSNEDSLFFSKGEQYQQALELIKKRCPQYPGWIGN